MNIILFGKTGQVGWELNRSLQLLGTVFSFARSEVDFTDVDSLSRVVDEVKPDIIVNAVAYTAVDKAEQNVKTAEMVNQVTVGVLAELAIKHGALLVHYSTDYVFDGRSEQPSKEGDKENPLNVYGKTKLAGEKLIQQSGAEYLIFRTSWVYASRGNNFIKTMLRLAAEKKQLKVVADQIGAPTSAELIADVTALVLYKLANNTNASHFKNETYHLTASGSTSWYGYAHFVIDSALKKGVELQLEGDDIIAISSDEFVAPAARPLNSCLDTHKLSSYFDLVLPAWELGVSRAMQEME